MYTNYLKKTRLFNLCSVLYLYVALIFMCLNLDHSVCAQGYNYNITKEHHHVLHTIIIPANSMNTNIVMAVNKKYGITSLRAIAQRHNAEIAVNAGFFENDGKPTGLLIIDGVSHGQASLKKKSSGRFNQHSLLVLKNNKVQIYNHRELEKIKPPFSAVMGIPLLLDKGRITAAVRKGGSSFFKLPHARTAIGLRENGDVVLVYAEDHQLADFKQLSVGQLYRVLQKHKTTIEAQYGKNLDQLTLKEVQSAYQSTLAQGKNQPKGMDLMSLAAYMKRLKCVRALNLDGGSSSGLWLSDKCVSTRTDQSERCPEIANALVFKRPGQNLLASLKTQIFGHALDGAVTNKSHRLGK